MIALLAQVVVTTTILQGIEGFGVAPGNAEQISMSTAQADQLFTGNGIGLTLARMRIGSYGPAEGYFGSAGTLGDSATSLQNYKLAQARGAQLFAVNLSCPASMKSGNNTVGGTVSNAAACANYYVSVIQDAKILGLNIFAIEWQNEPNAIVGYESTNDSAAQLVTFIDVAGPIIKGAFPSMKFIAPSSQDWQNTWGGSNYAGAILADGTAPTYLDYIGVHTYGSPDVSGAPGATGGRRILVTEMSGLTGPRDATMSSGLTLAGWLFDALGVGNVSGWVWWQFQTFPGDASNQGLYLDDGTVTKRLFVLGNYSKFVRPGFNHVATTGSAPAGVSLLAFQHPTSKDIAVVATNTNVSGTSLTITLDSSSKTQVVVPWVTDATRNLVSLAPIAVSISKTITITLPPSSVTTLSGLGT